jgi:hypothetical protein
MSHFAITQDFRAVKGKSFRQSHRLDGSCYSSSSKNILTIGAGEPPAADDYRCD